MSYSANSFGTPAQSQSVTKVSTNNSGSTIPFFMPVQITATGMMTIDPSIEADVDAFAGVTNSTVTNGNPGTIVNTGTVLNVALFSAGDVVYVSSSGGVTNIAPAVGSNGWATGDWVIKLGFIVKNEATPSQLDCFLNIEVVGQL